MYISDVITTVAAGGLAYSDHNRRKVLGSLRRCPKIYDAPAERIPADLDAFDKRWGRGRITSYPIRHFDGAKEFSAWRSNVRSALGQATGTRAAAKARQATDDGWSELLAAFDRLAGAVSGGFLFNKAQRIGLEWIADCARREGIDPADITIIDIVRWREAYRVTNNQKALVRRYAKTFDRLHEIPGIGHLLPPAPLGPLPKKRLANAERLAAMPQSFQSDWACWRAGYQRGKPSALTGSSVPRSNSYMGQFDAAVAFYLDTIEKLRLADLAAINTLRDIAHPAWLQAVAKTITDLHDEDGELVDDDVRAAISLSSLQTYLERLRTIFSEQDCAVAAAAITRMLKDKIFAGLDGMTPANIAFCEKLVRTPRLQAILFEMPWQLQAKAQALLARWDELSDGERAEAIRAGACAVAMLILTRIAPIRIGNLAAITHEGKARWLVPPAGSAKAQLMIPGKFVKNGKPIKAPLKNPKRRKSWEIVAWYLEHIRPRMIDGSVMHLAAIEGPYLFPGQKGALTRSTLRDWIKIETAGAGLPMTPHKARHALASILLNRHPDKIVHIAALLGDEVSTVARVYAWMNEEKLIDEAQDLIPDAADILREARKGRRRHG